MDKNSTAPKHGIIEVVGLKDALEERYLAYALSTITQRALPDARDGLKPVHRRVLFAMRELKLDPGAAFKKSARVVGDVIGKYHPHGDQSVYDALVRLAQDFSQRWPLIEGQGNFGNVDGDNAAAMRYTEARLTEVARLLLDGLNDDAVDFRPTYDGSEEEPIVLPSAFPNLLANGSQGIAVGMATSIPPHNAAELLDAATHLIDHPEASNEDMLTYVKGPDFPTGGIIVDTPSIIAESYRTGRGSFRVRARWHKEETGRGTWIVVVTEIPYGVPKSRLVEQLANLVMDKKVPILSDVRDESTDDVRLVLEPRSRTVDLDLLMESLFKLSDLESRISLNMNVLVKGKIPQVLGIADVLRQWLFHRRDVLLRRSRNRLGNIERRLEILAGLLVAYLNIDEVIRIIREEDHPKAELIRRYELTDVQAEAILNLRLRALAKLEEIVIRKEHEALVAEKNALEAMLGSETLQWKAIRKEVRQVHKSFAPDTPLGKRRTDFAVAAERPAIDFTEALVEKEPITVVVSQKGWIRALKGHVQDLASVSFKAEDHLQTAFFTETTARILVLSSNGKAFTLEAAKLPGGRSQGEPIRLSADLDDGTDVAAIFPYKAGGKRLLVSSEARGFVVKEGDLLSSTRRGKNILTLDEGVTLQKAAAVEGDSVAIVGENRKLLVFPLDQVSEMTRGRGVRLQRYKDGNISDCKTFALADGLTWLDTSGRTWTVAENELLDWRGNRAESGRMAPKGFPRSNRFS